MNYYKIHWNETRGDEYDDWGTSCWYLEVTDNNEIIRQLTLFDNQNLLIYSRDHLDDEYGGLSHSNFDEFDDDIDIHTISFQEFEEIIANSKIKNQDCQDREPHR
jgi:hypothetical protein